MKNDLLRVMLSNPRVLEHSISARSLVLSLSSSSNLASSEGKIGGGSPTRRWGRREGSIRVLAAAETAGLGRGGGAHDQSSPRKKEGEGEERGRSGAAGARRKNIEGRKKSSAQHP